MTDYITLDEFKSYIGTPGITTASGVASEDAIYGWAITAASRAIDNTSGRTFGITEEVETRYYTPYKDKASRRYAVKIDDITTISGLLITSDYTNTWDYSTPITTYRLWKEPNPEDAPYTSIAFGWGQNISTVSESLAVEAIWGWATIPDTIKQATAIQAARFLKRRESPFGIVSAPVSDGASVRLWNRLDPDVAVMIQAYLRY